MAPVFSELFSEAKATRKYLASMKRCKVKREASLERCNNLMKLISECNMSANQAGDLVMEVQKINWSAKLKLQKKRKNDHFANPRTTHESFSCILTIWKR
jgi:hypothetical protein